MTVESNNDPDKLFKFSNFKEVQELENIRSSVYYPTEMRELLKENPCKDCVVKSSTVYNLDDEELDLLCNNSTEIHFQKG